MFSLAHRSSYVRPLARCLAPGPSRAFSAAAKYVLAIDQGTTSSRAILFDKKGGQAAVQQMEFTQHYPKPGWAEHDPKEIMASVLKCCEGVMAQVGASKSDVAGIGITNQRETTVVWDKETGEPLHNAVVWLDLRTAETSDKLKEDGGQDRFRARTGLPVSTYFSAVKMKWLIDSVPAVSQAVSSGKAMFGTIESWLIYNLTGGASNGGLHITDVSNASRYMLMNLKDRQWDESVCKEIGIPVGALPTIRSNSEIYGTVKGGALDGLPISGSLGDQHAALLGQACLSQGAAKITYGTGCFTLVNAGKEPVPSTHGLLSTIGWQLGPQAETTYALEGSVACAGRSVQWLRDSAGLISSAGETEGLAKSVEDTGGVTFVPAFSGLFAPHWRSDARAVMVGMTLHTTKAHICRAVLEGVSFQNAEVLSAMQKDIGKALSGVRVDGGMTANNLLMEIQANLLGQEVLRAQMPEATALGAAFAAGLSTGVWDSVADIEQILKDAGGHVAFKPTLDQAGREKEHKRWADAVGRSLNLECWGKR